MDFVLYIKPLSLPYAYEDTCVVDGIAQHCIVIPEKSGQLIRTEWGDLVLKCYASYTGIDNAGKSHKLSLVFRSPMERRAIEAKLGNKKFKNIGKMAPLVRDDSRTPDEKLCDATPFHAEGVIHLAQINPRWFKMPHASKRRFLYCSLKPNDDADLELSGYIDIDMIPESAIYEEEETKEKSIYCMFEKNEIRDPEGYTHTLSVRTDLGFFEIGRFKERKVGLPSQLRAADQPTTVGGYKF
jgi:hypothetical protein